MVLLQKIFFVSVCISCINCFSQDTIPAYSVVKTLDKNDPHYFCEKTFDSLKIKEGFRVNDSVYGEMRLYEQGKLITILHFINEELNGHYVSFYFPPKGNMRWGGIYLIGSHKNGKKDGVWKEYDVEGKLISTKKYKNDEQVE